MSFSFSCGAIDGVVIVIDGLQCLIDGAGLCHLMLRRCLSDVGWLADDEWIVMISLQLINNNSDDVNDEKQRQADGKDIKGRKVG